MKKIYENLYILSKFSLSFTLLICLIGALYVLFVNYQNESKISQKQVFFEKEFNDKIDKNSELINKIASEIILNKTALNEINKNISSLIAENKNNDILNLNKNIQLLSDNFDFLSDEINSLKNNNFASLNQNKKEKPDIISKSKNDIIELILVKYENNMTFDQELDYLRKIINENKIANIEKISLMSTNRFKGNKYLNNIFNEEVDAFLKKIINKNPDSLFNKIVLPYLEVSPTSENIVTSDIIIKIKEIKSNIENRNIENALKYIITIKEYEDHFRLTTIEIKKYINFKTELYSLR